METCVGGSTIEKSHYEEWSGQEGGLLHGQEGGLLHAEEMESCLDGSFTEKDKCDGFEGGVQGVVTGSMDHNNKEGTRDHSSLNWPEENTEAIGDTEMLEAEKEVGDLFESYAASMGGRSEEEKVAADVSAEEVPRTSIHIETKHATENSDLFQSYTPTVLEEVEQIMDDEQEDSDKVIAEGILWLVGDRCVARWEEEQGGDGLWYRAQVRESFKNLFTESVRKWVYGIRP
jgi:hypothetical protein